jgi:phosphate transport system ATP-binding protein
MRPVIEIENLNVYYTDNQALIDVNLSFPEKSVYALIGPSGCGKSTLLRCLNRMNDHIPEFRLEGRVIYRDQDIYSKEIDPVFVRKRIGMVFQKPNPFPHSIAKNITWGPSLAGYQGDEDELVESSLKKAALWDEVKDRLKDSGLSLSGGQQQRLCIARAIAMNPDVILMDEPCASLDPISTKKIEDLIAELKLHYTIVIVTHSMQQARRVADYTAFMYQGHLIESGLCRDIFTMPENSLTRDYVSGAFG